MANISLARRFFGLVENVSAAGPRRAVALRAVRPLTAPAVLAPTLLQQPLYLMVGIGVGLSIYTPIRHLVRGPPLALRMSSGVQRY
jgi:hypothetical protein